MKYRKLLGLMGSAVVLWNGFIGDVTAMSEDEPGSGVVVDAAVLGQEIKFDGYSGFLPGGNRQLLMQERAVASRTVQDVAVSLPLVEPEFDVVAEVETDLYSDFPENVPNGDSGCKSYCKTYMGYNAVTLKTSDQYALLNSSDCYTDAVTGIRMVDGRYCIAVGSFYSEQIGDRVDVVLESGAVLRCIVGDFKADKDTNDRNQYHLCDGSVVEFIVDYTVFEGVSQYPPEAEGKVVKIINLGM